MSQDRKQLIAMVGLPRSGKSTEARKLGFPIVSPDAIRLAITGQRFVAETEPFVWATAKAMVSALFLAGHSTVILDATNNTRKRRDEWRSSKWETVFRVIDTPAEICIERAMAENDLYIIGQIMRMADAHEPLADDEPEWR